MRLLSTTFILFLCLLFAGSSSADDNGDFIAYPEISLEGLSGTRFQYTSANGGQDRCTVPNCMCRVQPDRRPQLSQMVMPVERRLSLYFPEASSSLSTTQVNQVSSFLEQHRSPSFTVVGYTDTCGTTEYNQTLVRDRVSAVRSAMRANPISHKIDSTVFNAEQGTCPDPSTRRVDVIAHTRSRLTTMLDKIQADVYLVDASGSMWEGWKNWVDLIAVSFKPDSRVYLSKTMGCHNGQALADVAPGGGTEIWYSYWKVLDWMRPGETLAIISDFRSDVPLTRRESRIIEQKVRDKNITVIAISP